MSMKKEISYREESLHYMEALYILEKISDEMHLFKVHQLLCDIINGCKSGHQIPRSSVEQIESLFFQEMSDPRLKYAWLVVHYNIQVFFDECNDAGKIFFAKVPVEKNLQLLKTVVSDLQSPSLDENGRKRVVIMLICYCFTLLCRDECLKNYSNVSIIPDSYILGTNDISHVENIRHAISHSNIELCENGMIEIINRDFSAIVPQDVLVSGSLELLE